MSEVVKIKADAGAADYRTAVNQLEWAVWNAEQIGFVVPTEVTAALMILRGQACITYFSNAGVHPTILCVGKPETDADFDDHMEMVEFVCERLKRRRKRARENANTVIGFAWPMPA